MKTYLSQGTLVKWKQFSFLHVSWETKRDLESIDQKACQRAIMSLQGRERKGQVPEIGKPPCSKRAFDPQMVEVVRSRRPVVADIAPSAPSTRRRARWHLAVASTGASRRWRGGRRSVGEGRSRRSRESAARESTPRPSRVARTQERVLELPGLVGGEAGEKRLALNLPPPDLEEDTLMEKDDTCEEQLEAAGGEALSNADKRKFAEEQYERALKETEAQGEARRKSCRGCGRVVCRDRRAARRRRRFGEVDGSGLRRSVVEKGGPTCWRRVPRRPRRASCCLCS